MRVLNFKKSFTLTEMLVYVAVLAIIVLAVSSFFLWTTRSNTKTRAMREALDNSRRAMEIMSSEIKEAKSIYAPTTTSTQLSLETTKYLPAGEETTYIDFYLCGTQLCLKKESQQNPIALTSNRVEVKNLVFSQIVTDSAPSIQINLRIDYKTETARPEYQASFITTSTISLRSY